MGAVQPAAAADQSAAHGDSELAAGADALELSISPKRALVSLAFVGALFARRYRTDGGRDADGLRASARRSR